MSLDGHEARIKALEDDVRDHETRTRALETFQTRIIAVMGFIAFWLGFLADTVKKKLGLG